jgi:hypothetical protein
VLLALVLVACGGADGEEPRDEATATASVAPRSSGAVVVAKEIATPRQLGDLGVLPYCLVVREAAGTVDRCLEVLFPLHRGAAPLLELQEVTDAVIRCWLAAEVGAPVPECWLR